jgi:Cu(I)/Ag(I) efflux system membrane fusion protein
LGWIRYGQSVDVSLEAYPGETFAGKIMFVDPFLNDETRTVKVRVNLPNLEHRLKPAMYASAIIHVPLDADGKPKPTGLEGKYVCPMHPEIVADAPGRCSICEMPLEKVPDLSSPASVAARQSSDVQSPPDGQVLAIRKSAVLDTGRRQVTYRKRNDGAFELVELRLGPLAQSEDEAGRAVDYYPVFEGLAAGDEVVVQGGFLLDSERQIQGMPSVLYAEGRSAASLHAGHGGSSVPPTQAAPAPGTSAPPATAPAGGHQH